MISKKLLMTDSGNYGSLFLFTINTNTDMLMVYLVDENSETLVNSISIGTSNPERVLFDDENKIIFIVNKRFDVSDPYNITQLPNTPGVEFYGDKRISPNGQYLVSCYYGNDTVTVYDYSNPYGVLPIIYTYSSTSYSDAVKNPFWYNDDVIIATGSLGRVFKYSFTSNNISYAGSQTYTDPINIIGLSQSEGVALIHDATNNRISTYNIATNSKIANTYYRFSANASVSSTMFYSESENLLLVPSGTDKRDMAVITPNTLTISASKVIESSDYRPYSLTIFNDTISILYDEVLKLAFIANSYRDNIFVVDLKDRASPVTSRIIAGDTSNVNYQIAITRIK